MYGQDMESFGLYEDLSLFNGDLLLEDANLSVVAQQQQGLKDGPSIHEAVSAPTPKVSVLATLAHPQNGSQELGLEDLLTASPTQDLPDPFTDNSAWFDTKTDLLDLLTGVQNQQPEPVQQVIVDSPVAQALPQQDASIESLEAIQALLLADLPVASTPAPVEEPIEVDPSGSSLVVYDNATSPSVASNADIDILDDLNQAGLEQLLANAPDPNTASLFDAPILSPVSAHDVESLLSSSPSSPSEEVTLESLFNSFTSKPATLDTEQVGDVLRVGPQRPVREKARTAPYTVRPASLSPAPAPTTSSRRAKGDRRERKKEQNRTAALRYREKKRSEQDVLQQEADELMDANKALREKCDSITREIKYLKDLMAEVKKARSKTKKGGAP